MAARWEAVFDLEWFFADRYRWPPTVVDEQPALLLDDIRQVALIVEEHRREQQDG